MTHRSSRGAAPPTHTTPWDACSQPVPRRHERGIRLRQERADGHRRQRWGAHGVRNATRWGVWPGDDGASGGDRFMEVMSVESEYNAYGERTRVGKLTGSRHGAVIRQVRACRRDKGHRRKPEADEASAYGDSQGTSTSMGKHHRQGRRRAWGGAFRNRRDKDHHGLQRHGACPLAPRAFGQPPHGWRSYPLGRGREADVDARQPVTGAGHLRLRLDVQPRRGDYSMHERLPHPRQGGQPVPGGRMQGTRVWPWRTSAVGRRVPLPLRLRGQPRTQEPQGCVRSGKRAYRKEGMARYAVLCRTMPTTRTTAVETDPFAGWQPGDTCYEWQASGMLAGVRTPDGRTVMFGYDALGRRVSKRDRRHRAPFRLGRQRGAARMGHRRSRQAEARHGRDRARGIRRHGKPDNLVTWVYDGTSFTPGGERSRTGNATR